MVDDALAVMLLYVCNILHQKKKYMERGARRHNGFYDYHSVDLPFFLCRTAVTTGPADHRAVSITA